MSEPTEHQHDDDNAAIEHSPLECDITRDDTTVRICIYRGRQDTRWLLEIEDEEGGSTSWDDLFDSDQEALDAALKAIEEEGIHSFSEAQSDPAAMQALWRVTMAQPAIAELDRIHSSSGKASGCHHACGVFAAVASVPEPPATDEWLELARGDHEFRNVAEAQRFAHGTVDLYNEVVRSVTELNAHCCPPAENHEAIRQFCEGYMQIASGVEDALRDPLTLLALLPIFTLAGGVDDEKLAIVAAAVDETPEQWLQRAREELADNVLALHAHWEEAREAAAERLRQRTQPQRRATPKVGRNERCPCGSGKKYKKCCEP
jgi:uncharacterized protein YecA (UPF0149 family)